MKKKLWLVLGTVLLVAAVSVTAVLLLRQPPLIPGNDIESIVIFQTGRGHKEFTDPEEQQQVLKLLNNIRRQEDVPEDPRKGCEFQITVFYNDGSHNNFCFATHPEEYLDESTGITYPAGEYMEGSNKTTTFSCLVEDGTIDALYKLLEAVDRPYELGNWPEERMREAGY